MHLPQATQSSCQSVLKMNMNRLIVSSFLLLTLELVSGFGASTSEGIISRNNFFKQSLASVIGGSFFSQNANAAAFDAVPQSSKVLRADKCAYGEGSGCESLAGDNEFIKELQRKSLENKEAAQKVRCLYSCLSLHQLIWPFSSFLSSS